MSTVSGRIRFAAAAGLHGIYAAVACGDCCLYFVIVDDDGILIFVAC